MDFETDRPQLYRIAVPKNSLKFKVKYLFQSLFKKHSNTAASLRILRNSSDQVFKQRALLL